MTMSDLEWPFHASRAIFAQLTVLLDFLTTGKEGRLDVKEFT